MLSRVGLAAMAVSLLWAAPAAADSSRQPRPAVSSTAVAPGAPVRLSGRLAAAAHRLVRLQRHETGTAWHTVAHRRTTAGGRYRFTTPAPTSSGLASYRVVAPRHGRHGRLVSRVREVSVSITAVSAPSDLAPPVPTNLNAESVFPSVFLDWVDAPTPDLAGYVVYRSASASGPWQRLNAVPTTAASYTDTSVQLLSTYYYAVSSLDTAGHESALSEPFRVLVVPIIGP
ncbi:hypothetical protein D9V37_09095 [Nocardioides mangrovicus]|uniref:Fibronectin type-III domain-containing protein n=1 Tax=Nocardioides mangrovicus TaxID=2478913 RepID=A0A3L8P5G8_9ACTN|nr:hypothetical protein [Nocardioides mangrovicus]RLV50013.1 hypothetical protein D9V37_09095 [Nocardioides mangrovicus]